MWGFNFEHEIDNETGEIVEMDIDPVTGYTEGFLVCPNNFQCKVTQEGGDDHDEV